MMAGGASLAPRRCSLPLVGDAGAQQAAVLVHALEHGGEEEQEAQVLVRRLAGLEQVVPSSALSDVIASDQLQCLPEPLMPANGFSCTSACRPWRSATLRSTSHDELVVVDGDVGLFEERRHLELARRDFVVARDDRHAELVELVLDFADAGLHALRDATEVVVFELLAARRRGADERAAAMTRSGRSAKCCGRS
jgi:hypothetical protein